MPTPRHKQKGVNRDTKNFLMRYLLDLRASCNPNFNARAIWIEFLLVVPEIFSCTLDMVASFLNFDESSRYSTPSICG